MSFPLEEQAAGDEEPSCPNREKGRGSFFFWRGKGRSERSWSQCEAGVYNEKGKGEPPYKGRTIDLLNSENEKEKREVDSINLIRKNVCFKEEGKKK